MLSQRCDNKELFAEQLMKLWIQWSYVSVPTASESDYIFNGTLNTVMFISMSNIIIVIMWESEDLKEKAATKPFNSNERYFHHK